MKIKLLLAMMLLAFIACNKTNTPTPVPGTTPTWVNTNFSVTGTTSIFSMLVTTGGRILIGTQISYGNNSLYFSADSGATWHLSDSLNPVKVNGTPYTIKQDPATGKVMIGSNAAQLNGLFTSTDDGKTWFNNPATFSPVDLAFMNNKSYMAIQNGVSPNPPQYLMSSTNDFSGVWTDCTSVPPVAGNRLFADNGVLFVAPISSNKLYRSSNPESKVYTVTDAGIIYSTPTSYVTRMAKEGAYLFAATSDGIFRSSDGGFNWTPCNLGFSKGATDFVVSGTDIYASLKDSAVYKSSDNGTTWTAFHTGLPMPLTINCMQQMGNYLLEGDVNSKVYKVKFK